MEEGIQSSCPFFVEYICTVGELKVNMYVCVLAAVLVLAIKSSLYMQHEVAHCSIGTFSSRSAPRSSISIATTGECGQVYTRVIIITSVAAIAAAVAVAIVSDARSHGDFHLRSPRSRT